MIGFKTFEAAKRMLASKTLRAPFSTLVRGKRVTFFYYGGWNMLAADQCMLYPHATYLR